MKTKVSCKLAAIFSFSLLVAGTAHAQPEMDGFGACLSASMRTMFILEYAHSNIGRTIGDGQCWTFVDQALAYAGAARPNTHGLGRFEFGTLVRSNVAGRVTNYSHPVCQRRDGEARPGDIVQLTEARLSDGTIISPQHTAIIESVSGNIYTVLEQNVSGSPVVRSELPLGDSDVLEGTLMIYAPINN